MAAFLDEILLHIFGYLDALSLTKSGLVSKQWGHISKASSLWRRLALRRWPSQRFLFERVPATSVAWFNLYQELTSRGNFSPDNMKYFVSCRVAEDELFSIDLREAMFFHMADTMSKWTVLHPLDNDDENATSFNRNLELFYDTHDLQWSFIDKRREYIDDLFCYKLSHKLSNNKKTSRHIRPYQVMPSCLLMYRWLCLFRSYITEEIGLTFYRIWRFRLKHLQSGRIFEVCDWKAAMSCSFAAGSPNPGSFKDDSLQLLNLLSHPHFIMHPMGVEVSVPRELNLAPSGVALSRTNSATSSLSSIGFATPKSPVSCKDFPFSTEHKDSKGWSVITSSATDSDEESEGGWESGYVTNCEYFISSHHWDVEEQHKSQAQVAGLWTVVQNTDTPHLAVSFDVNEGVWRFLPTSWLLGLDSGQAVESTSTVLVPPVLLSNHTNWSGCQGIAVEPIPSCLALYRLVCLMDNNARTYVTIDDASIWAIHLLHNQMQAILHIKDVNGWFDVSLTLTEDLQNQIKEECCQPSDEGYWYQACDSESSFSEYVASDEDSETSGDEIWCVTPTPDSDELESISSTEEGSPSSETDEWWWWTKSPETEQAWMMGNAGKEDDEPSYDNDMEPSVDLAHANHQSDSETSNSGSVMSSPLEVLKQDVRALLNLLMDETFAHPYGTVAGSVA